MDVPVWKILLGLSAGLVLFLLGVGRLSSALKEVAGERVKKVLERSTANRFAALATGAAATAVLDSSSAVIVIVVGMVDAGLLRLAGALGVVLGANVGTTVSSQLIASDLTAYAPVLLVAGLLLQSVGKNETRKRWGALVLGLGLIFYGLERMEASAEPLRHAPGFVALMTRFESPLLGALAGALVTAVIQSSSATVGIVIALASQGVLSPTAGIALMLGAEVGTCLDTLVASAGRSREAVRVGLFQLLFNLISAGLGLLLIGPLAAAAAALASSPPRQIANAHVLFNLISAALFLGLTTPAARALARLVPDRPTSRQGGGPPERDSGASREPGGSTPGERTPGERTPSAPSGENR